METPTEKEKVETRTISVKCTFVIPIQVPVDEEYDETFDIEENHCPGTGRVGSALTSHIEEFDKNHMCWACALDGKCEIL